MALAAVALMGSSASSEAAYTFALGPNGETSRQVAPDSTVQVDLYLIESDTTNLLDKGLFSLYFSLGPVTQDAASFVQFDPAPAFGDPVSQDNAEGLSILNFDSATVSGATPQQLLLGTLTFQSASTGSATFQISGGEAYDNTEEQALLFADLTSAPLTISVPEPASMALLASAAALPMLRRRRA